MTKINRLIILNKISKNSLLVKKKVSGMSKNSRNSRNSKINKMKNSKVKMKNNKRKMNKKMESNKMVMKIKRLLKWPNNKIITSRILMKRANKNPEGLISICLLYIYLIIFLKTYIKLLNSSPVNL